MKKPEIEGITIAAPNFQIMDVKIVGTAPFVQHKFSKKTSMGMLAKQVEVIDILKVLRSLATEAPQVMEQ